MHRASALDQLFVNLETVTTRQTIAIVNFLTEAPDVEVLNYAVDDLLKVLPRLGESYQDKSWTAQSSNRDFLEIIKCLPGETTEQRLEERFSRGLDVRDQPWKVVLILPSKIQPGQIQPSQIQLGQILSGQATTNNQPVLLNLYHHAFVDGLGCRKILEALCKLTTGKIDSKRILSERKLQPIEQDGSHEAKLYNKIYSQKRSVLRWLAELFKAPATSVFNGQNSNQRKVIFRDFDLQRLQPLKKHYACSMNDLLVAMLARACGLLHQQTGTKLPEIRFLVPFSSRAASEQYALGNRLSGVAVPIKLDTLEIPALISKVSREISDLMQSGAQGAYFVVGEMVSRIPSLRFQRFLCELQARRTHFICTNVPISAASPLYLGNTTVSATYGLPALMRGQGIAVGLITYNHKLGLSIVYDPAITSQAETLAEIFLAELEKLAITFIQLDSAGIQPLQRLSAT